MDYIDACVAAVPTANKEKYLAHAKIAAIVFKEYGATGLSEYWGDDIPDGEVTSFPRAVNCKEDETVVFSWISWPSKAIRDAGMEKVMSDPRLNNETNPMPFDGSRLIYGGFTQLMND